MTFAIPYWWSKKCYDITQDAVRCGWKALWFRIEFRRVNEWYPVGVEIRFSWANGAIFPRRAYWDLPR